MGQQGGVSTALIVMRMERSDLSLSISHWRMILEYPLLKTSVALGDEKPSFYSIVRNSASVKFHLARCSPTKPLPVKDQTDGRQRSRKSLFRTSTCPGRSQCVLFFSSSNCSILAGYSAR